MASMAPPGNGAIACAETQRAFGWCDACRCQQGSAKNALRQRHGRGVAAQHLQHRRHVAEAQANTARIFRHQRAIQAECGHGIPGGSRPGAGFQASQHRHIRRICQRAICLFGKFRCDFACHISAAPIRAR